MSDTRPRFPVGLTISTAVALLILLALGTWQLQRLAWKTELLDRIEKSRTAPAVPIGPVLAQASRGETVDWTRVRVTCGALPGPVRVDGVRYSLRDGEIVWRATSACVLAGMSYDVITVDRGFVETSKGRMQPPALGLPPIKTVTGVLAPASMLSKQSSFTAAPAGAKPGAEQDISLYEGLLKRYWDVGLTNAPFILMAEQETSAPPGVTPSAVPPDIANRHLEYALTWYGLAAALIGVYVALVRRKLKSA